MVSPYIQKYPEDVGDDPILWQVKEGRWHEIPLDELTPSILVGEYINIIHEVAELCDQCWVIPALWIDKNGTTHTDCYVITKDVCQ
jgi:hypothetical protein